MEVKSSMVKNPKKELGSKVITASSRASFGIPDKFQYIQQIRLGHRERACHRAIL